MSKTRGNILSLLLALFLMLALALAMMPLAGLAAEGEEPDPGTPTDTIVAAFDGLEETTLYQVYDEGTVTLDELDLPSTLYGTDADGDPLTIEGATWQSSPSFDPAVEAAYIFTPTLPEGYTLADGVNAPMIRVFIRPQSGVQIQPALSTWNGTSPAAATTGDSIDISSASNTSGGGTLTVPASATVTITGTVTNLTGTLTFNIASGATVKWQATLSGSITSSTIGLITLTGDGTFEVVSGKIEQTGAGRAINSTGASSTVSVSGGEVSATTGSAIYATGASSTVTVSGTGKVQTEADGGHAIFTHSNVKVEGNAEVSATTGIAIYALGASSTVSVSGGTVSATTGYAICATGASSTVSVSGGEVSATTGSAIYATGASSTVSASGGVVTNQATSSSYPVIYMNNTDNIGDNVTVSGTGKVQAEAGGGYAIFTYGKVKVEDSALVSATTGRAIYTSGASGAVTVSGTGKVQATAADGYAIQTYSNVQVEDDAIVSATTGIAIYANGTSSTVTVSGGTVSATTGSAISTEGGSSTVTVSGGVVSATTGRSIYASGASSTVSISGTGKVQATEDGEYAICTAGNVQVKDTAIVSATTGGAIYATGASSAVNVSGGEISSTTGIPIRAIGNSSKVSVSGGVVKNQATSSDNPVIYMTNTSPTTANMVTVSGTGKVRAEAAGGYAIRTYGNVKVEGSAIVSATTGTVIYATGVSSTVSVSGGTVKNQEISSYNPVIYMTNPANTGDNVTVSGTGKVRAEGDGGYAIRTYSNVKVEGSAIVSATTSRAISAEGVGSTVTVSGGTVFAYGSAIKGSSLPTDNVIYLLSTNQGGFTDATGTGVVIAWNQGANRTIYDAGTTEHILLSPTTGATAVWDIDTTEGPGIAYKNGLNEGFIPLGVSVNKITLIASDLTFTIPTDHAYTGSPQGIGTVTMKTPHDTAFTPTTGGTATLYYTGTGGTNYAKSDTAPTNAGTYTVTYEVTGGTWYEAVTLTLGSYTIAKVPLTISTAAALTKNWDGMATATAGAVTFTGEVGGQLLVLATDYTVSAAFTGGNYDAGTTKPYTYTVTMLDTTKANNYNLTANTKIGADGTISKIAYTGIMAVSANVKAGEATAGKTVTLPALPAGASYPTSGTFSGAAISNVAITGTTLTFDVDGTMADANTATMTLGVTGATNYDDYDVVVTVTAQATLQEDDPSASIDYMAEKLEGLTANEKYSINGGATITADAGGNIAIDAAWFGQTVSIVKTAVTASGTADSDPQNLLIPALPTAPGGVGKTDTTGGGSNGTITGVDSTMEYKGSGAWTPITDITVTGLAAATYQVRVKAVAGISFAGEYASVTIAGSSSPQPTKYTATVVSGTGTGQYEAGNTVSISASAAPSGQVFDKWTTTSSGVTFANANSESTSFTMPANAVTVTATYKSSGGGGGGGGGGGSSTPSNTITAPTTEAGWTDAAKKITDAKDGSAFTIDMKNTTTVSGDFLEAIAGKDVDLTFDMGGGMSWKANGKDIPKGVNFAALNLAVSTGTGFVPVEVRNIDGSISEVQLRLAANGEFPFALTLTVTLDKINAGYFANLFYYNPDSGELEFKGAAKIASNGAANFVFDHASDYLIVVSKTSMEPAVWQNPFTDVKEADWFYGDVEYAVKNGLFAGTSATTFSPNTPMTRGMLVTVLWRAEGSPEVEPMYAAHMMDIVQGAYYEDAMGWAVKEGIISGYGEGFYGPDDSITREQLATILYRYIQYKGGGFEGAWMFLLEYADREDIAEWAYEAACYCSMNGIITGKPGGLFDPQGTATRAEVAAVLHRYLEK